MSERDADVPRTGPESPAAPPESTWCATCGARIDPTAWHLVSTRVDDAGDFHLVAFCSEGCRARWSDR